MMSYRNGGDVLMKKKVILTGSGGFLSSRIYKSYENVYDITPLSRKELDITNHRAANKIIEDVKPDIIIHTAAISATQACEDNPELANKVNVDAAVNIARSAARIGAKMMFLSTEQIFNGNSNDGPYKESDEAIPSTVYGKTKLKVEELLKKEINELWILRLSWMFGLPEREVPNNPNLFWKVITAILTGTPIKISTNEYRGVTYVYDLIDNLQRIFTLPYDTYHFGSENEKSTYDTGVYILEQIGIEKDTIDKMIIRDEDKHKNQKRDLRMSYNKIKSQSIEIKTTQESIRRAIEEFNFKI